MKRLLAVVVMFLAGGCVAQDTGQISQPLPRAYFGLHVHRALDRPDWPLADFGSWRLWDASVDWAKLEPNPASYHFALLDALVERAELAGVTPLLTLAVTPRWAASRPNEPFVYGVGGASPPARIEDWKRFVSTLVRRYGRRIPALEIWNEPKYGDIEPVQGGFFSGSAEELVELACAARDAAQAIEPAIRIVGPGFTGEGDRLERFLQAGGGKCIDVAAFHFYSPSPSAMLERIRKVRTILTRNGYGHLPLWNTEQGYEVGTAQNGYSVADRTTEAGYWPPTLALAAAAGVTRFYAYSWERTLDDGRPGEAGKALAIAAQWLLGARVGPCEVDGGGVSWCRLERNDRQAWLVWREKGASQWRIPSAWEVVRVVSPSDERPVEPGRRISLAVGAVLLTGGSGW